MKEKWPILSTLQNENGVAIIAALLFLMLLSVVAITFTDTTVTEKAIVRSESVFERAFYKAESGAMEGIQKLANESDPAELLPNKGGAVKNAGLLFSLDREELDDNDAMIGTAANLGNPASWNTSEMDGHTFRRVVLPDGGGSLGHESSLKVTQARDYYYYSFGFSEADEGSALVKIGYVKHF